jgi:phosphoribosylanthranilate isomerase
LLGFIFYRPSPRYVSPVRAQQIAEAIRTEGYSGPLVGVFVDEPMDRVREIVTRCGLDYAQLHGRESPGTVATLEDSGISVIKAFRVRSSVSLEEMASYSASAYLLDAYVPGVPGGTGRTFDWELAAEAARRYSLLLAGGLTHENVAQAICTVDPWGVDAASGVEAEPGLKDPELVRRFVSAARHANLREKL